MAMSGKMRHAMLDTDMRDPDGVMALEDVRGSE